MDTLFEVLHEDAGILVVNKPAGLVCHPTKGDVYSSLISRVRLYLGAAAAPQLINRLDRETSGLVVVGKTAEATRDLRRLWESRVVEKEYLGLVHGAVAPSYELIDAPLGKADESPVVIKDKVRSDGASAQTEFWVERVFVRHGQSFSLLRIRPRTGRKHQIRIHMAWRGHPLVGDKLYGPDEQLYLAFVEGRLTDEGKAALILPFHALHAWRIQYPAPGGRQVFEAQPEGWFKEFAGMMSSGI